MPITQESSGSQTATIGTEHTLATVTTQKTLVLSVDCANLAAGEYVEIKVKRDVRSADATRTLYSRIVSWLEAGVTPVISMPPVPAGGGEFVGTLKQLNGTGRAFPWAIDTPG
jgi:hypothetical protein